MHFTEGHPGTQSLPAQGMAGSQVTQYIHSRDTNVLACGLHTTLYMHMHGQHMNSHITQTGDTHTVATSQQGEPSSEYQLTDNSRGTSSQAHSVSADVPESVMGHCVRETTPQHIGLEFSDSYLTSESCTPLPRLEPLSCVSSSWLPGPCPEAGPGDLQFTKK